MTQSEGSDLEEEAGKVVAEAVVHAPPWDARASPDASWVHAAPPGCPVGSGRGLVWNSRGLL